MPFDGIVAKCVVTELTELLAGGRVEKIFQPEADEININIRSKNNNYRLILSANANYPRIHITGVTKDNPAVPPVFCMLLRKHLTGGRIISFEFNGYERIIGMLVESANELGDVSVKKLIIEIMGRHSNIILVNAENKIIDSIKHIDADISSVREIMPARPYLLPPGQDKMIPEDINIPDFIRSMQTSQTPVDKYLLEKIKGFSPLLCREICYRAGVETRKSPDEMASREIVDLEKALGGIIASITNVSFKPSIVYEDEAMLRPLDYHCLSMTQFACSRQFNSISEVLDNFYNSKDAAERLKQKQADLLKVITNSIDRCRKKLFIQEDALREVADREKLRLYGELVTANIYCIQKGLKTVTLHNYYSEDNETVEVPLDENLLPQDNAQRYFKRYTKAKSTFAHTSRQLEETRTELDYLESVLQTLENCTKPLEMDEVRQELAEQGYTSGKAGSGSRSNPSGTRKPGKPGKGGKTSSKKQSRVKPSEPLRFKSSDGYDIFVGKNNRQNDQLTLKQASSNDIWLHTKDIHGSHVIIRKQQFEIPDSTLREAAVLAAWHSKARMSSNIQVDYTAVRHVSKPSGAKPGMVVYVNHRTLTVNPDAELVKRLSSLS
ncbi:MAG: fibronectin/fibrinogen-binding protein [Clostridiales bacterium]|nr:fibronectin/fibrinogen-binding protein [Clostridiales bacterium]